ncbi:hypothetical protein HD806DRAFT_79951 [Xylariaceae sp. AK1471]|nr:hypothetical protein HD806DRAFT_79951 [Xylariaceae sp. AK1471]
MQTLWSRAAQAQSSCRCRICLHSTNAIIRRSTTAAPKRKVTAADIFTACYTTILGTAAIIDARRKNERRRELDGELDRARASLKKLVVHGPPSSLEKGNGATDSGAATPKLSTFITSRRGNEAIQPFLEELRSLCNITYRPLAHQSWMQDQIDWTNIEAAVAAEEQDPNAMLREPQTHDHLTSTTTTVLDLVDELVRKSQTHKSCRLEDKTQISGHADDGILKEVEDLRRGHEFPSYQFPSADPSYSAHVRNLLNESIRRIFNQAVTTREIVGRICYNLLTAGVPPTIHTYNTLIAGFNRIQRPDLAQAVINSYLDKSAWPATDQTVICLLNHYRGPGGREGMRDAVQRMRGAREDGLHLATLQWGLYNWDCLNSKQRRAFQRRASKRAGWVEKANRNDATFDCLIRGWLYHEEIGIAYMTFVACLQKGASIPVYTLQELFRGCLITADFSSARKLLVGIVKNFEYFKWYLAEIIENNTTAVAREILQSLHQILTFCWLPMGEIFGQTYQTYAAAASSLKASIKRVDLQLEVQETARLPSLISDALSSSESLLNRVELAISSLDIAKLRRRTSPVSEMTYARLARLVSIERRYVDLEERTQHLAAAFNAAIISVKTGYDIDTKSILLSKRLASRAWQDRIFALRSALNQINVWHGSLTTEDVASQLFRRIPNQVLVQQLEETGNWESLSIHTLVSLFGENAAFPQAGREDACDSPHQQLEQQIQAAEDSTRALLFTHVPGHRLKRAMYHYRGYYEIPLEKLAGYLEKRYHSPAFREAILEYDQSITTCNATKPLQPRLEEAASSDHPTVFEEDDLMSDSKKARIHSWRRVYEHGEHQPLPMLREEGLQHAALG